MHQTRTAIFPGTFDPFTIGHADIVERGLKIFDEIVISIGVNINKAGAQADADRRVEDISRLYAHEPRVKVRSYSGLTSDLAAEHHACALLRGIRSVKDMEYERDLADANRRLSGIETVILYTDPALSWVSSSLVRELMAYGRDVSQLLPLKPQNQVND